MRLKTLKISGFKSFADRVVITFDAPLMGIVGPNGCGKSNIVDAFRWVLGEQSARSLRGTQMHDVIFAGSSKRKGAPVAEVSVTLYDIQPGELSLPHSEITITRRLYRDGRSEYLLNREPARLRDIQHLFLGTGVGRGAFSIFEQGKIDRIISLQPTARREIFDEAAGIGRFLERKKETLRKLSSMMENYNRLRDLHGEVDRQTKTLKRQAAAAEKFLEKKQEAEQLEKDLLITKLKKLRKGKADEMATLSELEASCKAGEEELSQEEKELIALKTERDGLEERATSLQDRLTAAERQAALHQAQQEQQQKRKQELATKRKIISEELDCKQEELEALGSELARKREGVFQDLDSQEQKVKALQKQYLASVQKKSQLTQEIQTKRFELQKLEEAEKQRIAEIESQEQRKLLLTSLIAEQEGKVSTLKASVAADLATLKTLAHAWESVEKDLAQNKHQATELRAAQQLLEKLKAAGTNFSKGAKQLLDGVSGLAPLATYLTPKKGKAKQLDAAVARYRQTLVAKDKKSYLAALKFAEDKKLKDFSLFCLEGIKDPTDHFLHDASFEGDHFIDAKRVLFAYGEMVDAPFQQQERLQAINDQLPTLEKAIAQLQEKGSKIREERQKIADRHRKEEMHLVEENFALTRAQSDLTEVAKRLTQLQGKKKAETTNLAQAIGEAEHGLQKVTAQIESDETTWHAAEEELKVAREEHHALSLAEAKHGEARRRVERLADELAELIEATKLCDKMLERREHLLSKEQCEALKKELLAVREALTALREKQKMSEERVAKGRSRIHAIEQERHAHEVKLAEEAALDSNLVAELVDRFSVTAQQALTSDIFIEEIKEAEAQLKTLRQTLERSGAVNLMAIESYAEQSKRFEELDQQLTDLVSAKEDLEALIAKLDHESRQLFKETFSQIRENFQRNFQTLFGGGEADLRFTDGNDILEAGIDIIAKPPGKQMRSISLLSGGEKCLTALALLFSLFEVKPAPFCILDEVDAPLDETNVGRFTQMLGRYLDKTQFLIVTHNKKTMAVADRLIGVSMEEKGVSKLLSLTFSKNTVGV